MSLKKSDGQGVNPGYPTGRGTTPNTSDNEAHQKLIDAGITGFPVAATLAPTEARWTAMLASGSTSST